MSFKLPNFLNWVPLNALRNEMKAPLTETFVLGSKFKTIDIPIIERLKSVGVDVKIEEVQVHSDGTLTYNGYRVILYIRDIQSIGGEAKMPKFHLAYCLALEKMHKNNRFDRYVVANNDTGNFQVNIVDRAIQSQTVKLSVCQNCLDTIHWKGFDMRKTARSSRLELVSRFALVDFFKAYPRDLISATPQHTADTAPLNDYSQDWPNISKNIKITRGHQCKICNIILKFSDSKYLHVHHKNGQKYDNRDSNLDVLCIACHANQPMHEHMKSTPDYKAFMTRYPR